MAEPYIQEKIPTSDSTLPEYEVVGKKEIFRIWVCKVCKEPFAENEGKVVCEKCRHYCHAEHSSKYQMRVYDHLCLVDELGVNKQSFKVLYGIAHGWGNGRIRDATKLSSSELNFVMTDLRKAGLIRNRLFFWTEITYKAHEMLPTLEEMYGGEKDVEDFKGSLGADSASGFKLPSLRTSPSKVMFAVVAIGILAIMLIVVSSALSAMREFNLPSSVVVIVWILLLMLTIYIIYKIRGLFG